MVFLKRPKINEKESEAFFKKNLLKVLDYF